MRGIVTTLVREAMEEFEENRRRTVEMVEQVNALSGQFDARVTQATTQIGGEVQARDAQRREHVDTSARQNNDALATMQQKIVENLELLKSEIGVFVSAEQARLSEDMNSKAHTLYLQAQQAGSSQGGKGDGGPVHSRERNIYDVRDYKIADLEKGASMASFKKWKHDLELYIETIGASWSGVTSLLRHCRLHEDGTFDETAIPAVIKIATDIEKRAPLLDPFLFKFNEKADALYKLVMPRLPVDLATEIRQTGGESNGFELFRKLTQKLEPARSENAFHPANEIRGLAGAGACKNLANREVRQVPQFEDEGVLVQDRPRFPRR